MFAQMQHNSAFSLLEFLLVLTLIGIIASAAIPVLNDFGAQQKARQTLDHIKQILRLARSLAIVNQQTVTLCASSNGYSCNQSWRGILLESNTGLLQYFDLNLNPHSIILLSQSGKLDNKVEIQANGMVQTNGHFSYKSLKASNRTQFNLYFNKALKIYVVDG